MHIKSHDLGQHVRHKHITDYTAHRNGEFMKMKVYTYTCIEMLMKKFIFNIFIAPYNYVIWFSFLGRQFYFFFSPFYYFAEKLTLWLLPSGMNVHMQCLP